MPEDPSYNKQVKRDCKHGHLARSCDLCELERLEASQVETVLTGADCDLNTITLRLPKELSTKGMAIGQIVTILNPNKKIE
jgi:hypothetical protein